MCDNFDRKGLNDDFIETVEPILDQVNKNKQRKADR